MSVDQLDDFFLSKEEPLKSCLLYIRDYLNNHPFDLQESWKWSLPSYSYNGKHFCYIWIDKKTKMPYIGFKNSNLIEHDKLELGNRKLFKTFSIDPTTDIDVQSLDEIMELLKPLFN